MRKYRIAIYMRFSKEPEVETPTTETTEFDQLRTNYLIETGKIASIADGKQSLLISKRKVGSE